MEHLLKGGAEKGGFSKDVIIGPCDKGVETLG